MCLFEIWSVFRRGFDGLGECVELLDGVTSFDVLS